MDTKYLYVMGAGSGAGKSTVCLGLLAWLLARGFAPRRLAYIKPMTQCTEQQAVTSFCQKNNIANVGIGCMVYNTGYTKDFIDGHGNDSATLQAKVLQSIYAIGEGKALVVVDGVGDPSVGSVVGVSSADLAATLRCRVLFVGKPGIGAAVDNTVLCASFLQSKGIRDIGVVYNNIKGVVTPEIKKYLAKSLECHLPGVVLFGFISINETLEADLQCGLDSQCLNWFSRDLAIENLLVDWLGVQNQPEKLLPDL